jgi:peptidyl-prolyl cis-trans isomerase SurA
MIDDLMVKQKADELQIGVSEEEIDNALARIAAANNLTIEELYNELERTGIDRKEYRKNLSRQILQSKLVNYEIQSKIVISDKQAREYYENVYTKNTTPPGYHLLQIGITWGEPGSSVESRAKAKKRAEGIRKQAVSGLDFSKLAESFSELPSAKAGGDIGFFKEDEMAESLRETIVGLKPGQVSKIIETDNSFQFYRLVSRNIDGTPEFAPYSDVKEEILDRLHQEELDRRYKKWLQEIKEQAIIKKLI